MANGARYRFRLPSCGPRLRRFGLEVRAAIFIAADGRSRGFGTWKWERRYCKMVTSPPPNPRLTAKRLPETSLACCAIDRALQMASDISS
jgi:hypothetical protein